MVGNSNSYLNVQMGSTNGNNLGIATALGGFSTSAAGGDKVLRSLNRLILQSGGSGHAILIDGSIHTKTSGNLAIQNPSPRAPLKITT
jgi:hypothetical protein